MAHLPVRHPYGAPLAAASKLPPAIFIEPKGSYQGLPHPKNKKPAIRRVLLFWRWKGNTNRMVLTIRDSTSVDSNCWHPPTADGSQYLNTETLHARQQYPAPRLRCAYVWLDS